MDEFVMISSSQIITKSLRVLATGDRFQDTLARLTAKEQQKQRVDAGKKLQLHR